MRIIALSTLKAFWEANPSYSDATQPALALKENWTTPAEVKADFKSVSIIKEGRVVSNIAGNKFRLVVWVNYAYSIVYIRFIGTHAQYDQIDAQTI